MSFAFLLLQSSFNFFFFSSPFTLVGSSTHLPSISSCFFFSSHPHYHHMAVLGIYISLIPLALTFCLIKDSLCIFIICQSYCKLFFQATFPSLTAPHLPPYPNHFSPVQCDVLSFVSSPKKYCLKSSIST